jgi:hypothetical protein
MLLSRKAWLPGIGLDPVESEIGRQSPAEAFQSLEQFGGSGFAGELNVSLSCDIDNYVIAFLEI